MKKMTDFLTDKRNGILAVMLILCLACAVMIPGVKVNQDLTKYLPSDSPMKIGLDIMKQEFPELPVTGCIRIMFTDLDKDKIPQVTEKLQGMQNVAAVMHDDTEKYNRDAHTLFEVNCPFAYNTSEELALEKSIQEEFAEENMFLQHTDAMITGIPVWVFIVVVLVLMVILFVMCSSYVEPFLFLFTIGVAICLNMGTNIIFGSISQTTFTLSAILQLVLSMDYSVILMNRYRQAKEKITDSQNAMKEALKSAFPSVISSGMTTVLGLVMLVFMRFKIGLDIGRVMAKGVAFSMVCVLTVLPALILIFDKWIEKTKKKELHVPTDRLAKFSFKARRGMAVFFVVLFAATAVLQSVTDITFAPPKFNNIENIFPAANPMVLLYNNKDEKNVSELAADIEKEEPVHMVMSYSNTLGKQMTADEMKTAALTMMPSGNSQTDLLSSAVDLLFYHYFKNGALPALTVPQFMSFMTADIMKYDIIKDRLSAEKLSALSSAVPLMNKESLTVPMTAKKASSLLNRNVQETDLLYAAYYASQNDYTAPKMALSEFVDFIKTTVVQNPVIAGQMDASMLSQLDLVTPLLYRENITKQLTADELAQTFGIKSADIQKMFLLKFGNQKNAAMSLTEFSDFLVNTVLKNPMMASKFNKEAKRQIYMMKNIMENTMNGNDVASEEMAKMLFMDENLIKIIYTYRACTLNTDEFTVSLYDLVNFAAEDLMTNDTFKTTAFDENTAALMTQAKEMMEAVISERTFTANEMFAAIQKIVPDQVTQKQMNLVYLLYSGQYLSESAWKLSVSDMADYLEKTILQDELFEEYLDENIKTGIHQAAGEIEKGKASLQGPNYSLMMIDTTLPPESKETTAFVNDLKSKFENNLSEDYYLIGNSPMNVEMEENFGYDMTLITVLTAFAIFMVVALTFRSAAIPAILVLLVQCGVFITVAFSGLVGHSIYYLSMLIVQCILMGATIDYGIVFTNYYVDNRKSMSIADALLVTFRESIHTILTSSLIIALITGIIGITPADPAFTEICQTLSVGAAAAVLLIIFVLPGILAALDKWVAKDRKRKEKTKTGN